MPVDTPTTGLEPELLDLVERCILAFERDGESGLENELTAAGPLAGAAREHLDILTKSGLLRPPELPESIGPYRVLKRLGTGGMGAVFLCEQPQPTRRLVAIKVIRPGMNSHEILARFALEQMALGLLDHPGIAHILDAGSTDQGHPYLVMDYVAGVPIHHYCDERQLGVEQRLQLFLQVCDAVQHAHQKGIIHRDLKPTNVLVSERDGQSLPVVIDFGVAKSLGNLSRPAHLTAPGHMLGTPEYMSPEQAANECDVDTRADVYSLGVMLYELLTGCLPYAGLRLRGTDLARALTATEPPKPSTQVARLGSAADQTAALRRTNSGNLQRMLQGDLDWVVMRALAKDRNRRYGMPGELAGDIRRHLQHEPVTAGPPGSWYRLTKFCARHRLQAGAAALVLGALGAGLVTSTVFYEQAAASSASASRSLDAALVAVDELVKVGADLASGPQLEHARRDLLSRAAAFYRQFLDNQRDVARGLPRTIGALVSLGRIRFELGDHDETLRLFDEAVAMLAATTVTAELTDAEKRITTLLTARPDLLADFAACCCARATARPAARQPLERLAVAFLSYAQDHGLSAEALSADRFTRLQAREGFRAIGK